MGVAQRNLAMRRPKVETLQPTESILTSSNNAEDVTNYFLHAMESVSILRVVIHRVECLSFVRLLTRLWRISSIATSTNSYATKKDMPHSENQSKITNRVTCQEIKYKEIKAILI